MKEEPKITDVTFTGQEATKLDSVELNRAIEMLRAYEPANLIANISHNCETADFVKALGATEIAPSETTNSALYGLPVYKKSWIPLGEVWLQDKEGKVIKKFSIKYTNPYDKN